MASCVWAKIVVEDDPLNEGTYWGWRPPAGAAGCTIPTTTAPTGGTTPPSKSSGTGISDPSKGGTLKQQCFPAQASIPGTPGLPPTPSQIVIGQNKGWNTHARSKNALPDDHYFQFNVMSGSEGVFVGLGAVGMDGEPLTAFDHGLMFTIHGVHVFESGVEGDLIASSFTTETVMKITRDDDTVTYSVGATNEVSLNTIVSTDELFVYAYMYTAGDTVFCPAFKTLAGAAADGDVAANAGDGAMSSSLPALNAHLVYTTGLSFLNSDLPSLYGSLVDSVYTPPQPVTMMGNLPIISGTGFMLTSRPGDISASLPALDMLAGDYQYGVLSGELPAIQGSGYYGVRLDMDVFSYMLMVPMDDFEALQIMVMMEGMQITGIQAVTRIMVQQMIESLQVSGTMSMLGEYALSMNEVLGLRQYFTQTVGNQPSFDASSRVWVLNTDTAATVQFDNYAFNSYFHHNGEDYGVADNGIYRLGGDDDAGDAIQAEIQLGSTLFGAGEHKRLPAIYVNAASDGKLIVKISVDGEDPWYYEARSSSDKLSKHRVDPGKGLMGTNWTFTLLNQDGDDFELADLTFIPLTGSRRI